MSFQDPSADPVQPDEGQGGQANEAPYAEYLNRIPEEARGAAEEAFKAWDAGTQQKFQDAAEYRRTWEPYEQLGVHQNVDPATMSWLMQFQQALQDPQAIQEWYQAYAEQNGIQAAQPQQQPDPGLDLAGWQDPSQQQLEQLLAQHLQPVQQGLNQMMEWRQQQELAAAEAQQKQFVEGQLAELAQKHGDEFNREGVESFVAKYLNTNDPNQLRQAVPNAWRDYQDLVNQVTRRALQSKVDQPEAAESGGPPDSSPEQIKFKDTEAAVKAMLRAQQQ